MLESLVARVLAGLVPSAARGAWLHRAALRALVGRRYAAAEALFEGAARCYRRELKVEPLARLRVHQLIARARAHPDQDREGALTLEIERRLCRLHRIESLEPEFPLADARALLAEQWSHEAEPPAAAA